MNPYFFSVQAADLVKINEWINKGGDVNIEDEFNRNSLHYATKTGNCDLVDLLISKGTQPNMRSKFGMTPLCMALECNYINIALKLLGSGAVLDFSQPIDAALLTSCARNNNIKAVKLLLEQEGGNVRFHDYNNMTALDYAVLHNNVGMIALLKSHGVVTFQDLKK